MKDSLSLNEVLTQEIKSYLGPDTTELRIKFNVDKLSDYFNESIRKTPENWSSILEDREYILRKLLKELQNNNKDNVLDWLPNEVDHFHLIHITKREL